jgi:hypothetical protein
MIRIFAFWRAAPDSSWTLPPIVPPDCWADKKPGTRNKIQIINDL